MKAAKKLIHFFALCSLCAACAVPIAVYNRMGANAFEDFRKNNRKQLNKIQLGMTKQVVMDTMGVFDKKIRMTYQTSQLSNPYKRDMFQTEKGTVEILYYYTDVKAMDNAITEDELTPLIFIADTLRGMGYGFVESLRLMR